MLRELTTDELFFVAGGDGDGYGGDGGDGYGGDGGGPSVTENDTGAACANTLSDLFNDLVTGIEKTVSTFGNELVNAFKQEVSSITGTISPDDLNKICPTGVQSYSMGGKTITVDVSATGAKNVSISDIQTGATVVCK